ncbi:MAG: hypothetical protein A2V86_01685 [Deltaproteobacteria bacterium RBG_16_49_23]|nr:MAG: hypothetical protein A2V86_01685 [Deltaproteobacteria bacterium RBG_16_49_23]
MKSKGLIRRERIIEYLDNIERQLKDIRSIPISSKDFFLNRENSIQIKAIKYSLACAIQDITRISAHIASTLSLWKVRESEAEAILALAEEGIITKEFAEKIKGMPSFRNRIIHDYLPNEFDAEKLYESLQDLDDFKEFSRFVLDWISKMD